MEAPTTETKIGVALDATKLESEVVIATMIEVYVEIFTIKSSPEWRGTLIKEKN